MKIMHFIHGLSTGGAETLVKNYMLNFDCKKNDIVLLCLKHYKESPYEMTLKKNGIKIIFVEDNLRFRRDKNVSKILKHFERYLVIRKIIAQEKPDLIHGHIHVNDFIKFAKPDKRTIIVYTVHTEPKRLWPNNTRVGKREFRATNWLAKKYDMKFVVLHEKMRNEINELFGIRDAVIFNNGIDISKFKKLKNREEMRDLLGIPRQAFVVGHVGRFAVVKNHDFLVDVFKRMDVPNKFLLMVGDGAEKNKIEKKMHDLELDDKYLILSNRDDIPDILSVMDVFVFPSLQEGMPTSLIEAQEAKLPCFVSNTVTNEATISNLVVRMSLKDGAFKWAEAVENYQKPENVIVNDADWDIKKITNNLEKMYFSISRGEKR